MKDISALLLSMSLKKTETELYKEGLGLFCNQLLFRENYKGIRNPFLAISQESLRSASSDFINSLTFCSPSTCRVSYRWSRGALLLLCFFYSCICSA